MREQLQKQVPLVVSGTLIVATTLVVRVARGIRPFPSIDDFAYLPLARRFLDGRLFPDDIFVSNAILHAPAWSGVMWLSEQTVGLAKGFGIAVLILSLATVVAVWLLMRALGGRGVLLPAAAMLAFVNRAPGLGRGLNDGAFGDGFHAQWLALCLMLWTYVFWIKNKPLPTGVLLGLCVAAHPVVGVHAFVVLTIATLVALVDFGNLLIAFFAALVIAAPVLIPIVTVLLRSSGMAAWPAVDLIQKGFLFRTSHEFTLELTSPGAATTIILFFVLGLVGSVLLTQLRSVRCTPEMAGLLSGHAFLAGAFVVFHGNLLPHNWRYVSTLPYLLHLSRTTPILIVLSSVLTISALEAMFDTKNPRTPFLIPLRMVFLIGVIFLFVVYVEWSGWLLLLLGVACLSLFLARESSANYLILGALLVISVLMVDPLRENIGLEREVAPERRELYTWVTENTAIEDLFIIPPGFQEFRTYTLRGAFVDFKLFPASSPFLIPEWRRRIDLVAVPDRIALQERGWPVATQLDRTYAQVNQPDRIADLLSESQADYFVFDREGETIPPYLPLHSGTDPRLEIAFENGRYRVFRLRRVP